MNDDFLTQAQQACTTATQFYGNAGGAETTQTEQFWAGQAEQQLRKAQALALLSIATDLNRIANHLDALTEGGVAIDGGTLEALRTMPLK